MSTYYFPSGLILPFNITTGCPSGWTRFTALDNRFPRGAIVAEAGQSADVSTHTHSFDPPNVTSQYTTDSESLIHGGSASSNKAQVSHRHSQYWDPVTSAIGSHLPLYIKVVYCKKD